MAISDWNKNNILKFTVDNTYIDEYITDFPVLLNLSSDSGKNSYDCTEVFDALTEILSVPNFTGDDFSGIDGDPPNEVAWVAPTNGGEYMYEIFTNTLHIQNINSVENYQRIGPSSTYTVSGNFDISIDWAHVGAGMGVEDCITFIVFGTGWRFEIRYRQNNNYSGWNGSGWSSNTATSVTSGSFRIARVNSTITAYYKDSNNPNWVVKHYYASATGDVLVKPHIYVGNKPGAAYGVYFDNYSIVADGLNWPVNINNKKIAVVYPSIQEHTIEEYDKYTKLLIQSDSTPNLSTNFIDSTSYKNSITPYGDAKFDIAQAKFGTSSTAFNGVDAYLTVPLNDNFNPTGDYTIEAWIYSTTNDTSDAKFILSTRTLTGTAIGWSLYVNSVPNNYLIFSGWTSSGDTAVTINSGSVLIPTNVWVHVAACRLGTVWTLFVSGQVVGSASETSTIDVTSALQVGRLSAAYLDRYFEGYMEGIRITKGLARYTEDFTVPTSPYTKELVVKQYTHGKIEQCFVEISEWDTVNKQAQLWVKIPKVLEDQPTDFYLFYDRSQPDNVIYVGDTGDTAAQAVWDGLYSAVFHMNNDPSTTSPQLINSTSNNVTGSSGGYMLSEDLVSGPGNKGKALAFDGEDDYMYLNNLNVFISDAASISISTNFMMPAGVTGNDALFSMHGVSGNSNRLMLWVLGNLIQFTIVNTSDVNTLILTSTSSVRNGNWHNVFVSYNNTSRKGYLYVDGVLESSGTGSADWSVEYNGRASIGQEYDTSKSDYFNGTIGEIHISNQALNPAFGSPYGYSGMDTLMTVTSEGTFSVSGYIKELGKPVERTLYLYDRASGELMDKTISNTLGYYTLYTTNSGSHNIVCQDTVTFPDFDDLIISKVRPTEVI